MNRGEKLVNIERLPQLGDDIVHRDGLDVRGRRCGDHDDAFRVWPLRSDGLQHIVATAVAHHQIEHDCVVWFRGEAGDRRVSALHDLDFEPFPTQQRADQFSDGAVVIDYQNLFGHDARSMGDGRCSSNVRPGIAQPASGSVTRNVAPCPSPLLSATIVPP